MSGQGHSFAFFLHQARPIAVAPVPRNCMCVASPHVDLFVLLLLLPNLLTLALCGRKLNMPQSIDIGRSTSQAVL